MPNADLWLGVVLMLAGVTLVAVTVFRVLAHVWTLGIYELWVFPIAGLGLILLGRWLIA